MQTIRISEHFYSIQGEGTTVGVPAVFLRLQGCNLNCGRRATKGTWQCDTYDVWTKGTTYPIDDCLDWFIKQYGTYLTLGAHLIITGGEPLLQQDALVLFLTKLNQVLANKQNNSSLPFIEVETNGTITPSKALSQLINQWNISPKLSNSGEKKAKRKIDDTLLWFSKQPNSIFKFVGSSEQDIKEILTDFPWISELPIRQKHIMPTADNRNDLHQKYQPIIKLALKYGFSVSQRFHLTVWNQKTGV